MILRHPLVRLWLYALVWLLIVLAGWCLIPTPRPEKVTPTRAITVLPTQTVYVFSLPATPTVTPVEAVLVTRVPSATRMPTSTVTPVPPTPSQRPVQRG